MIKWILLGLAAIALVSVVAVTFHVEREAPYSSEVLARGASGRALVLYHPSRDAHFSDELSLALARGFEDAKLTVERRTMTGSTPATADEFAVIVVVSNTFYGQPDWPTKRYLKRARFEGIPTIGIMAGAGSTQRAQAILAEALQGTGADLRAVHSLWTLRPNDPARPDGNNRQIAANMARKFAFELGQQVTAAKTAMPAVPLKMVVPVDREQPAPRAPR